MVNSDPLPTLEPFATDRSGGFIIGTSTAAAGDARSAEVQRNVLEPLGLAQKKLVTCGQVHGNNVALVLDSPEKNVPNCDGLITDRPDVVLAVFTADCVPIFLTETRNRIAALLHAGWRGTVKEIAKKGVEEIVKNWNAEPSQIQVRLGPHIQQCCYEVGPEVANLFPRECRKTFNSKIHVSLQNAIIKQFQDSGVPLENITPSQWCTSSDRRFFSFRREQDSHRMLSFIAHG